MNQHEKFALIVAQTISAPDPSEPLKDRLKGAMKEARDHWMVTDENAQFAGAVTAVSMTATEEEKEQLSKEVKALNAIAAALAGVPVDMGAALEAVDPEDVIGLQGLWLEVKEGT